ncbi:uncharacterized protein EAE97_007755 [Botrytis byssoidea]|uniref:Uncharacterized protein n=1 Tax=Botrytis byssoidea TaxID=139641 RepID=A0A9P5ILZ3_9HELO|nr:uncharacterized protein EAE97_007755 [Botrytis byssoidea]KAF7937959.1 hypothetical protein EAE97_007755 [Botrytis byssoidea]
MKVSHVSLVSSYLKGTVVCLFYTFFSIINTNFFRSFCLGSASPPHLSNMKYLLPVTIALQWATQAQGKAAFAHFMVTNSQNYTAADWSDDISLAQAAHIDAFALNMAYGDPVNSAGVSAAFAAADSAGFNLFFSFDYAGNGAWPMDQACPLCRLSRGQQMQKTGLKSNSRRVVFFMPDWSSLGAKVAMEQANGVADGLFSWDAWPWGGNDIMMYGDASYDQYLGGKPYMMPVSPWFYTNLPGYDKNWLWRGDHIWADRWIQAMWWQPEFVEIISWNDYGESHHIGPLRDNAMAAFDIGEAPFNYALQHDGWRDILPFAIDMYKNNVSTITKEGVVVWHRLSPAADCFQDNTTVNTASQLQMEFPPAKMLQDAVFFTALLAEGDNIGGMTSGITLYHEPEGGAGLYMGYADFNGLSGIVDLQISRGGQTVVTFSGSREIATICANGYNNFNAFVESAWSDNSVSVQVPSLSDTICVNGTGYGEFEMLCNYACGHGYCPRGACQPTLPEWTGVIGHPVGDDSFGGLCGFACGLGYCPTEHCSTVEVVITPPAVSPFTPSACTGGSGIGDWNDICTFTCAHGFCPIALCECEDTGILDLAQPNETANAISVDGDDFGLCGFACDRGHCLVEVCVDADNMDQYGYGPDYNAPDDSYYDTSDPLNMIYCDASSQPTTLDDLLSATASQSIPSQCWSRWTLGILLETLDDLQDEYNTSVQGFDDKFGYYVQWVKDSVGPALSDFMDVGTGNGNAFFDCRWIAGGRGTTTVPCTEISSLNGASESWNLEYTLVDSDGFYAAVASQLGIERDWIAFGDWEGPTDCVIVQGTLQNIPRAIGPGGSGGGKSCVDVTHRKTNVPIAASNIVVTNPKTVIEAAMPNITALADVAMGLYFELALGISEANDSDITTAFSTPVFMLQNAVDSMNNIKDIGAEVEEEDKKNLILEILGIVLMVVPIIGEGGGALFDGIANVARIATLVGDVGNAALTAYDIVEDPSSAPFSIMGLLLGGLGKTSKNEEEVLGEAAAARRSLSDDDLAQFGKAFVKSDSDVQSILKACISGD